MKRSRYIAKIVLLKTDLVKENSHCTHLFYQIFTKDIIRLFSSVVYFSVNILKDHPLIAIRFLLSETVAAYCGRLLKYIKNEDD